MVCMAQWGLNMPQHKHIQKHMQQNMKADQRQLRERWVRAVLNRTHNHMLAQSGGHTEPAHAQVIAAGLGLRPVAGDEDDSLGLEWVWTSPPLGGLSIPTSSCLCLAAFSRLMRAAAAAALSCCAIYVISCWRCASARQHSNIRLSAMAHDCLQYNTKIGARDVTWIS